jgi:hypothetical protein
MAEATKYDPLVGCSPSKYQQNEPFRLAVVYSVTVRRIFEKWMFSEIMNYWYFSIKYEKYIFKTIY